MNYSTRVIKTRIIHIESDLKFLPIESIAVMRALRPYRKIARLNLLGTKLPWLKADGSYVALTLPLPLSLL